MKASESFCGKTPRGFSPGEIALFAMRKVQKDEGERDYLADALFKLFDYEQLEVLLLETSGPYKNTNTTKIDYDNHKGMYGLLAMLKEIASTYKFANIQSFYDVKVFFVQAANKHIYLWSLRFLEGGIYEMWREEKIEVDDNFSKKDSIVPLIQFLWNLKGKLEDLVENLNKVKEEHQIIKKEWVILPDFRSNL